jgi:hypothetical protein
MLATDPARSATIRGMSRSPIAPKLKSGGGDQRRRWVVYGVLIIIIVIAIFAGLIQVASNEPAPPILKYGFSR